MIFTRIETKAFRNLADPCIEPHRRFNLLTGDNAQGKTNFLEAIYLLSCQRSFRASKTSEMIRFEQQRASARATAIVGELERELVVELTPDGRKVLVDGKATRAGSTRLSGVTAILFCSEDLLAPRGSPGERRRLIDQAIATIWPGYTSLQRDYGRVLQSRNRVLRTQPPDLHRLLDVYDQQLAALGAKVVAARVRYLDQIGPTFGEVFGRISPSGVSGSLRYCAPQEVLGEGDVVQSLSSALSAALAASRGADLARRSTTVGPHTDDIEFLLDAQAARRFGSQGQVRTMVLAFRITQILDSNQKLGRYPVLLLDDVSSELDASHNKHLFDFIKEISCQVFVTTTRPELIPLQEEVQNFQVVKGSIRV